MAYIPCFRSVPFLVDTIVDEGKMRCSVYEMYCSKSSLWRFLSNKFSPFFHCFVRTNTHDRGVTASRRHRSVLPRCRAAVYSGTSRRRIARARLCSAALGPPRAQLTARNVSYSSTLARKSLCVFSGRGYSPGPYHGVSSISFKGVSPQRSFYPRDARFEGKIVPCGIAISSYGEKLARGKTRRRRSQRARDR